MSGGSTTTQEKGHQGIGASATPGKGGYIILSSIIQHKFAGTNYPVNTKESEILG